MKPGNARPVAASGKIRIQNRRCRSQRQGESLPARKKSANQWDVGRIASADVSEGATATRLRSCSCRECEGIIFVLAREHPGCSTSVLPHLGAANLALHRRHSFWGTRHRRRAEAAGTMVTTATDKTC